MSFLGDIGNVLHSVGQFIAGNGDDSGSNSLQKVTSGAAALQKVMPSPADGRTLLGVHAPLPGPGDQQLNPVYQHVQTPTPTYSIPQPDLQLYGDKQGNMWMEDSQGNRHPLLPPKQGVDQPRWDLMTDPLRPGETGPPKLGPGSDGVQYLPPQAITVRSV